VATINDLVISVSEMLDNVLFEHIKEARRRRRTPVQKKTKAKKASTSKVSIDSLVSKLSSTDVESLIKQLEGS